MSLDVSIQKKFKTFSLDITFSSKDTITGILGASGCGKSMTLKCIAGIETPDSGSIVINGRTVFDSELGINIPPRQRRVGYMFQNYALFPHMTVTENLGCALQCPKQDTEKKIQDMLTRFDLLDLSSRYPAQLSGGQQQRVALARIMIYEPEVFLLDEPFSALDFYLKEKMQIELLQMLKDYSGDSLLVTHSRDEVYKLCENLMVIDQGKSLGYGLTKEMFQNPKGLEIAKLTGCKNFSNIKKIDDYHLIALDWGITLRTSQVISPDIDFIGIRAHDFIPVDSNDHENVLSLQVIERLESPFESNVIFQNGDSQGGETEKLWWKFQRDEDTKKLPKFLKIPPKKIILLRKKV